jgi:polyhydroxyalkanoate synthesis regulator phasin
MASEFLKRVKPILEAGLDLTKITPARAEALVRELAKQGEVHRQEATAIVQMLVERGKQATEKMSDLARGEVADQLDRLIKQVDALEAQVAELATRLRAAEKTPAKKAPAKKAPAKKAPVKKAPVKKATAKKAPAATTPAKKAPAATTPVKKAPAKKSAS